ncbi:hypothetical protein BIW11_14017 [Tropilaelaps mercedesae]|uniref:Ribosomal protein eL8/eL30/eS12/Gadd45 domain-containing protein n=1 Tax=Tropilaelaps mercedesae TaxID=418985 RepID=A0A1V9WZM0_9ACAR|nr:hypothetical protein BIW11_14017 [Tropilaelaps mercedesae]
MTSTPVVKVQKAKPKKTLRRLMLAALDEPTLVTINEDADQLITGTLSTYLKEFDRRDEIRRRIMLGLNTITRAVESCSENLKAVLLNASTRPQRLIIHLQQLCIHKRLPVVAVHGMEKIAKSLQGTVKGLKTNVTAMAVLAGCSSQILRQVIDCLPPADVRPVAPSPPIRPMRPSSPPPRPKVDIRTYFIEIKETDSTMLETEVGTEGGETAGPRLTVGHFGDDFVNLTENSTPFVNYDSFIGSDRPLETRAQEYRDVRNPRPSTSSYRPPVVKIR